MFSNNAELLGLHICHPRARHEDPVVFGARDAGCIDASTICLIVNQLWVRPESGSVRLMGTEYGLPKAKTASNRALANVRAFCAALSIICGVVA